MWESIAEILVRLLLEIHSVIYSLISNVYQVFIAIASARIFTADKYQYVANRIYVVIGVAALFFVAYGLLQAIINPESSGKNDKGVNGIVKNLLISIALIAFIPAIFNFAYNIQSSIIGSNVIGKIFLNTPDTSNMGVVYKDGVDPLDEDVTMAGAKLANDIFISFFSPIDENGEPKCIDNDPNAYVDCLNEVKSDEDITLGNTYTNVSKTGKFAEYRKYSANAVGDEKTIEFNWFMQFLVGILLVYVFVSFCIDMGLRTVKLCYYELIAPIPILTMIIPGQKKIFDSWKKNTISTFLDVFIHIAVVFFVLLLIKNLPSLGDPIWNQSLLGEPSNGVKLFARIFIIVGLLMFMKQAPKLFGDLFGISSGSFKLGIGDKLKDTPIIGSAYGAATGAAGAAWTAKVNGGKVGKAALLGSLYGAKGKGSQFNKQREKMWSDVYGMRGPAGILGGRPLYNKWTDELKNTVNDEFLQFDKDKGLGSNSKKIERMENKSKRYKKIYQGHADKIHNAKSDLENAETPYINQILAKQNILNGLNVDLQNNQSDIDKLNKNINDVMQEMTSSYLNRLNKERELAVQSGDTAKVTALGQKIQEVKNGQAGKDILSYAYHNNSGKYENYKSYIQKRSDLNNNIKLLNQNINNTQSEIDKTMTNMNNDQKVLDARKAINSLDIGLKDENGNKISVTSSKQLTDEVVNNYIEKQARDEFRRRNDEYNWRVAAEDKEKREVDIKKAETSPDNQVLKKIFMDAAKTMNKSDDNK